MKKNMFKWIENIKNKSIKAPLPILSFPGIQLLDISVFDLVKNGKLQAECMIKIAERYKTAASVSNMDLSIEAEAFGADVIFSEDEIPSISGRLIDNIEQAKNLKVPNPGKSRDEESIKAVAYATDAIIDRPIFAGAIGPFSLAGRLMEMTEIMIKSMTEPDTVHMVLKKTTEYIMHYILEFKKAGADGVIIAEPAAGLLSADMCTEFSSQYVKQIIEKIEDESFLVIYHNCGNTSGLVDSIVYTNAKAVHLGNNDNLYDVIQKYPKDVLVMGNIDAANQFQYGTEESISNETNRLLTEMSKYPNWLISSGCDIPPKAPLSNIDAFFKTVKEFYQ